MEQKNEGICRFCLKIFSNSAMTRHLLTCKAKKEKDEQEIAKAKSAYPIYHIKISSYRDYWMHIEMKATATLRELDDFLRKIWLECCGHLSMFTINDVDYQDTSVNAESWDSMIESIDTQLIHAMKIGDKFTYEYDFGTSTDVESKVIAVRQGVLDAPIRILARNNPYIFECGECGRQAIIFCTECECLLCEQCVTEHECGDDTVLPIVNSPRMGECGYTGDLDFDTFSFTETE